MHLISRRAPCVKHRRGQLRRGQQSMLAMGSTSRPGTMALVLPRGHAPGRRLPPHLGQRFPARPQALPLGNRSAASRCVPATWYNLCWLTALGQPAGLGGHEACCRNPTVKSRAPKLRRGGFLVRREHAVCYGAYPIGAPIFPSVGTVLASYPDATTGRVLTGLRGDPTACKVTCGRECECAAGPSVALA